MNKYEVKTICNKLHATCRHDEDIGEYLNKLNKNESVVSINTYVHELLEEVCTTIITPEQDR